VACPYPTGRSRVGVRHELMKARVTRSFGNTASGARLTPDEACEFEHEHHQVNGRQCDAKILLDVWLPLGARGAGACRGGYPPPQSFLSLTLEKQGDRQCACAVRDDPAVTRWERMAWPPRKRQTHYCLHMKLVLSLSGLSSPAKVDSAIPRSRPAARPARRSHTLVGRCPKVFAVTA
jgi:hypothetical protein